MDYTDWMLLKLIGMFCLAVVWGFFCGFTGRPLQPEQSDKER